MVSLIAYKCFATKILFCLSNSQILQQLLNLIAKHQNSVNSKNPHMYSWKIMHGKHKRIALQSLINGNAFCNMLSLFCRLQKITRRREKSNYYQPQWSCDQGNVFTGVCLSTGGGGCLPQCMLGCQIPLDQADPPGSGRPPWTRQTLPPPGKQTPAYGLRAAGTHPTGMHSCCKEQSFCESIMMIYTRHLLQHVLVEKNRCYFSEWKST